MKKLTIIHTTQATILSIPEKVKQRFPDFEIVNVLDDSLLNDIKQRGEITKSVVHRFIQHASIAVTNASDGILLACSSLGVAGEVAREIFTIPIFKIDEPMADKAVTLGNRILVLGTVPSTLSPTSELIKSKCRHANQTVTTQLIEDAFQYVTTDKNRHDTLIANVIDSESDAYDVIVLAQASMASALELITSKQSTVLTSVDMGIEQLQLLMEEGTAHGIHKQK